MTIDEVSALIGTMANQTGENISLIETHISWVIVADAFVYKIKKPMKYSFLDYSTPEKRRYCCYKELILNRRITRDIYLDVSPICFDNGAYHINSIDGNIVDYAVKMKRLDESKLMIHVLRKNEIKDSQIATLARKIAHFHLGADIIADTFPWRKFDERFADIEGVRQFLTDNLGGDANKIIDRALTGSTAFLKQNAELLDQRVREGFYRDVHGDLHAKNIFLYEDPIIFDCIEFSDEHRQMDVLNEVAFCCMDLEANERYDISKLLLDQYLVNFTAIRDDAEMRLFIYFKAYRANVRAKINALRAMQENNADQVEKILITAKKYLKLMSFYMDGL